MICWIHYSESKKYGTSYAAKITQGITGGIFIDTAGKITASITDMSGKNLLMPSQKCKTFEQAEQFIINYKTPNHELNN